MVERKAILWPRKVNGSRHRSPGCLTACRLHGWCSTVGCVSWNAPLANLASTREMNSGMTTRSGVPVFDNAMSSNTEHRKRAVLYSMKMKLDGKEEETALTHVGLAWDAFESVAHTPDQSMPDGTPGQLAGAS